MSNQVEKTTSDLCAIQCELKAPKSKWNKFSSFYYRSTEDILEAVKPLLAKYGCELTISDECSDIAGIPVVKAVVVFIDSKGKDYTSTAFAGIEAKKGMDMSQVFGSASTYARKYALNGMFLIDDTKDADSDEYQEGQQQSGQKQSGARQQSNNQQQSRDQQQQSGQHQNQMRDVTPPRNNGQQQGGKASRPIGDRFNDALSQIKTTQDPCFLDLCVNTFGPTQFSEAIQRACEVRASQMGWTKGG